MQNPEGGSLSPRQAEIAQLVVSGKSTREIALALTLSPRTVETHIAAIYNKYGVSSRAELLLTVVDRREREPSPAAGHVTTNLPVRRGQLIGRDADIENVIRVLSTNRLVTITGAGGIGKTQAALAVGEALLGDFRDGVWLVELAALAHGSPVAEAVARALGIQCANDLATIDSILAFVQRKMMLLIIDNCEHVIAQVAALADTVMRHCPRVHMLATSREPLRIAGEQTYRLPSLAVPTRREAANIGAARGGAYAAIELFTARAHAVDFNFVLDDQTAPIVADICRKIDGIPLAIELAAARVKVLPVAALAAKIESHLAVLAGGDRLALPRHRTMHALIDWRYHLLSPAEQRLFERMSVFAGGCALEEVIALYRGDIDDELTILELLCSLVDKSMLVVDRASSNPRYALLQSFGQYASEKLDDRGESTIVRQRHATVYTRFAERLDEEYHRAPTESWYARAEIEFENFVSALTWALDDRRDVALAQRLAAAMRPVWIATGAGQRWLPIVCDLVDERTPPLLAARLTHATASAEFDRGEFSASLATSRRLIATYTELGEPLRAAYAQSLAAYSLVFLGRAAEAEPLVAQALHVARTHERGMLVAFLLRAASNLSSLSGDLARSRTQLAEALAIYERIGAHRQATSMLASLAELEFRVGSVERALQLALRCLTLQREGQRWRHLILTLANTGAYCVAADRWEEAWRYSREALTLAQEAQHATAEISALQHLAAVVVLSAHDTARAPASIPAAIEGAARLLGYVDARVRELGVAREYTEQQEYDRIRAPLGASVPADDLTRLMRDGSELSPDAAIAFALSIGKLGDPH